MTSATASIVSAASRMIRVTVVHSRVGQRLPVAGLEVGVLRRHDRAAARSGERRRADGASAAATPSTTFVAATASCAACRVGAVGVVQAAGDQRRDRAQAELQPGEARLGQARARSGSRRAHRACWPWRTPSITWAARSGSGGSTGRSRTARRRRRAGVGQVAEVGAAQHSGGDRVTGARRVDPAVEPSVRACGPEVLDDAVRADRQAPLGRGCRSPCGRRAASDDDRRRPRVERGARSSRAPRQRRGAARPDRSLASSCIAARTSLR